MNQQERAMLRDFLDQLVRVRGIQKVPEADAMITRALVKQPDAAYLLVQKALLLEQALAQAKARIAALEGSAEQDFLDNGFRDSRALTSTAGTAATAAARAPAGLPVPPAGVAGAGGAMMPAPGGSAPSFLAQATATAAGVAGGAFLFEGLEGLLDHHSSSASGEFGAGPTEDVTINNYYASDDRADADEPVTEDDSDAGVDDNDLI